MKVWAAMLKCLTAKNRLWCNNMPTYVQDPITRKFVLKSQLQEPDEHAAIHVMEDFQSPIDGSRIASKAQLAAHNKRHGVTNHQDYGDSWFKRKAKERDLEARGQTTSAKAERIHALNDAFNKRR